MNGQKAAFRVRSHSAELQLVKGRPKKLTKTVTNMTQGDQDSCQVDNRTLTASAIQLWLQNHEGYTRKWVVESSSTVKESHWVQACISKVWVTLVTTRCYRCQSHGISAKENIIQKLEPTLSREIHLTGSKAI